MAYFSCVICSDNRSLPLISPIISDRLASILCAPYSTCSAVSIVHQPFWKHQYKWRRGTERAINLQDNLLFFYQKWLLLTRSLSWQVIIYVWSSSRTPPSSSSSASSPAISLRALAGKWVSAQPQLPQISERNVGQRWVLLLVCGSWSPLPACHWDRGAWSPVGLGQFPLMFYHMFSGKWEMEGRRERPGRKRS